ncbi:MAG: amidohydrolase family protein [Rhodospirillaceae bacterium]|jgi:N-acyl-D-amino-acid deacylase|nr:amidohydrolase family protein [Rhodospirillaceae bacterium]MBT3493954.1 amidohydrolase family protein [Rhodospirillaceae bacterium]MBT3780823.1 amidohydrolase family protein [Rhodospirillaceae bacterium]MBT3976250.1 amidohydrolase family protein [Rhodospirillaceae bacterium]MBT4167495.1 amidohydrolase family protein [Rhodospirillaceae bacterium]
MAYDLVVRNGTVIDGSGMPRYRADVGVKDGRIAHIGRIPNGGGESIDAEGHIVSPGFVDGHTHMDAQIFWDPLGSCSCYHGVTSVVMGNCGFTLAPCRETEIDYVFRNLERAEDISREAMKAGIEWRWETFPEYLDVLDGLPKGINYAGYIGHSALRTYVMGERAFAEAATNDELAKMAHEVQEAVRAGAIGFSSSRSPNHETSDYRPVASRAADWNELATMVRAMGGLNAGILELAGEPTGANYKRAEPYFNGLKDLSVETGRPITFGMFSTREKPQAWRPWFDVINQAAAEGGRLFVQVHSRELSVLLSFETATPFDNFDVWREIRALPLEQQKAAFRDPATKAKLIEAANRPPQGPKAIGTEARPPEWDWLFLMNSVEGPNPSMTEVARQRGVSEVEAMIDIALERDFKVFFRQPIANEDQDQALEMMQHPRSVVTFSDSGAHVSQIMDSSLQTHIFSHWVREKQAFTLEEAVRLVTYDTATHWGFHDRGLIREGMAADLVVFDPDTIGGRMPEVVTDLPAAARRLKQTANGIHATVVNGEILLRDNQPTGATPGRLIRGPLARQ